MAISGLCRMVTSMLTRLAFAAGIGVLVIGMTASVASAAPHPPVPGPGGDRSGVSRYFSGPQGFAIPTVPCDPAGPSATDGILADQLNPQLRAKMAGYMDAYKVSCARMVTQAVKDRGLNQRAATIAIATVIVESSLNNYAQAVDYTSLGLFQQQDWWGTRDERLNPAYATNAFFDEVERMYPGGSWNNEAVGEVCWHVQRPREDLRGLYAVEADDAALIANALWSGTSAGGPKHPYGSGRVTTGRSADGRLEAFAAGADGVYHAWQTAVNGGWSQWRLEGGPRNAQLAVAANADGRLEVFALSDSTFDHMWQTSPGGSWSAWGNFGGGGYRLAAGNNADGRIEVFASNATGVFHRWQTAPSGGWAGWEGTAGGPANSRLAIETAADGRLEVFALSDSTFEHLYQTGVNGGWSAWENFGGGGHDLSAGYNQDGRLEVFASNANGVFHRWQTSPTSWSDWAGMGGITNAELTVARSADGRVEVYAINANAASHAWQTRPNAPFSAWETFGGGGTEIAAGTNADGRIEVLATSHAGVYHRWQTGFATWSEWAWLNDAGPAMA
ncbi:peptidase M23 [Streptomyces sp. ZAF1911]|uniref:peptidase M23 n=1 Tax=unclassified Streptomyces TaxID=2593676 RepID=UPI00237AF9DD|nr:peptidase M23 [Streptomyces sp. ZAF1911]MDD9375658.1 peptidase M23 [Streptomyces sp. ZAF1911]